MRVLHHGLLFFLLAATAVSDRMTKKHNRLAMSKEDLGVSKTSSGMECVPANAEPKEGPRTAIVVGKHGSVNGTEQPLLKAVLLDNGKCVTASSDSTNGKIHTCCGFVISDAENPALSKTCFLSKKTLFTNFDVPMNTDCQTVAGLRVVDVAMKSDAYCISCKEQIQAYIKNTDGVTVRTRAEAAKGSCDKCNDLWNSRCSGATTPLTKEQMSQNFADQQVFMMELASKLLNHGVSLYLDFLDFGADFLVEQGGGRDTMFSSGPHYDYMLRVLQKRAIDADVFLHWVGASGPFCIAEESGRGTDGKPTADFEFPPISTLPKIDDRVQGTLCPPINPYEGFLQKLCRACNSKNCGTAC